MIIKGVTLKELTSLGESGLATTFDGINERVNIPSSGTLTPTVASKFSVSFWLNNNNPTQVGFIVSKRNQTTSPLSGWQCNTNASIMQFLLIDSTGGSLKVESNAYVSGWNCWTMTYDGSGVNSGLLIYKNGILDITANTGTLGGGVITSIQDMYIGAWNSVGVPAFLLDGSVAQVAYFNDELTLSQVNLIYNRGRKHAQYTDLPVVSHWKMSTLNPIDEVGSNNSNSVNMDSTNVIRV